MSFKRDRPASNAKDRARFVRLVNGLDLSLRQLQVHTGYTMAKEWHVNQAPDCIHGGMRRRRGKERKLTDKTFELRDAGGPDDGSGHERFGQ